MTEARQYATVAEAAKHFNVHTNTIRRWIKNGVIPETAWFRAHTVIRICLPEAEAYLLGKDTGASVQMGLPLEYNEN